MIIYGYIRKDFPQETTTQINRLMAYGCQDVFIEKSDLKIDVELKSLLNTLTDGDKLIVTSVVTFGKALKELQQILSVLNSKNVVLISLEDNINEEKLFSFQECLELVGSINKEITSEKVKQRLVELQDSGKQLGRPAIDEKTINQIKYLRHDKQLTLREISVQCDVSLGTVYKYIS